MITAEGCRARRLRLWERLDLPGIKEFMLADPTHVRYLANAYATPISFGAEAVVALAVRRDGSCTLYHDSKAPDSLHTAHVDQHVRLPWYDGIHPGLYPRQLALMKLPQVPMDLPGQPHWERITRTIADMRRKKDPDELATISECCRVAEAGHDWALYNVAAGMTELDVYDGIEAICNRVADEPVIVYGDFVVSPGPERLGGHATAKELKNGDLMILDVSVVLRGYRCDFTNTLCVGGEPKQEYFDLLNWCKEAMAAGEQRLKAGALCQSVYDAVAGVFAKAGKADRFPHHAGHGIGLTHPEAPFFVKQSTESLREGDVVTLEPGLYVIGLGGLRIEHNYHVTAKGFERLSQHKITLAA
jgi:Xaa-Pro aminopeptidase